MSNHSETISIPGRAAALSLLTGAHAVCACLVACSGDVVDLGEVATPPAPFDSLCQASTTLTGAVTRIENQDQLDQLAGCQVIEGDLFVRPFEGADFRPLASLRSVGGLLELGRLTVEDVVDLPGLGDDEIQASYDRETALTAAGWITSLAGFEQLERVSGLALNGVAASDLRAFSNLRELANPGTFFLGACNDLRDLSGLENMTGLIDIGVGCDHLQSLAGLRIPTRLGDVNLQGAALSDLGQFDVETVGSLVLQNTGLENLDALGGLRSASTLAVEINPELVDMNGLGNLVQTETLSISNNPQLSSLPSFTRLGRVDKLMIESNEALAKLPSFPALQVSEYDLDDLNPTEAQAYRPDLISVRDNASIVEWVVPPAWQAATYVDIAGNARLTSIDFSALTSIDRLNLAANPRLEEVALGALATVDHLRAVDNPLLPLTVFDGLRTFEAVLSQGPLPEAPLPEGPLP
jgi:hypothetical protein